MEKTFTRELSSLDAIFAYLGERVSEYELDNGTAFAVNMAVEELFTNMVKYNRDGNGDIQVEVVRDGKEIRITMVDPDSAPFDITSLKEVDTSAPLDERRPGGLGIHLVRCLMDEVTYEYKNRRTSIRLVKNIP